MRSLLPFLVPALALGGCAYASHEAGTRSDDLEGGDAGVPIEVDAASPIGPEREGDGGDADGGETVGRVASHPHPAVSAAIAAWRSRATDVGDVGDPDTDRCVDLFAGLEIVVPDDDMFRLLCHRCNLTDDAPQCDARGRINACATWGDPSDREDGRSEGSRALIVIDATLAEDPGVHDRLVVHEAIHHLGWCSLDGADYAHSNDFWWCGDDADCITAQAQAAL